MEKILDALIVLMSVVNAVFSICFLLIPSIRTFLEIRKDMSEAKIITEENDDNDD